MIAKQIKGSNFYGCLAYVLSKHSAVIIDGNVSGTSPGELTKEFQLCSQNNRRVTRPVYHAVLSTPPNEKPDPGTWKAIASDFLEGMNFTDVPYIVVEHNDTDHNHIHIVAGRVRANGTCVSDSWDYIRSPKVVRHLEDKYGLSSPINNRYTLKNNKPIQLDDYQASSTDESGAYNLLKTTIDSVYPHCESLVDLAKILRQQDIKLGIRKTKRTNTVQGVRYGIGKYNFSGTQLGRDYTLPGLTHKSRRSHQLTFNSTSDLALIESLRNLQVVRELEQVQIQQQQIQIKLEDDEMIEIQPKPRSRRR
ncbi:Relaxase/mobilization nuclease family protein (plasmid) [Gloeothece citriformis PCC 7424]|uniref:Relaxase/mobilization nuclease family protein n=1 Tax=Gloeothece citriformis (strain PCC 7424) TaxID=65393 RepID=B7KMJ7_GLOC7|nr:relaxase/mobilization nuclease domain-containing protein [Gloeothece citriformis]ACK74019.1 Relaxase/mobilization nuclease family protein [Gloeothece citriformis PCC 7424]